MGDIRDRYILLSLSGHKRLTRRRQRPGDISFFWIPLAYLHIFYISTICNITTHSCTCNHVLFNLLMKIKFFRQKRQAAEEKRKEERSALETVRMEYLISNEQSDYLLSLIRPRGSRGRGRGGRRGPRTT